MTDTTHIPRWYGVTIAIACVLLLLSFVVQYGARRENKLLIESERAVIEQNDYVLKAVRSGSSIAFDPHLAKLRANELVRLQTAVRANGTYKRVGSLLMLAENGLLIAAFTFYFV